MPIVYIKRGLCRKCNDQRRGKLKWEKIKSSPEMHALFKERMAKNARVRRVLNPLKAEEERNQCKKWYSKNKDYRHDYYHKYYHENIDYHHLRQRESRFGGLYMEVIKRDNYKCVNCLKHLEIGRYLNVHHKDRNKANNTLSNLVTVCTKCHHGVYHRDKYERKKSTNYISRHQTTDSKDTSTLGLALSTKKVSVNPTT
jgi:5-methylcytosine-specific restriction endonuclease McrA